MKLSGVARKLSLAAGKNSAPRARKPQPRCNVDQAAEQKRHGHPLAPARSGCGQRALSASNSSPDVKTQPPGHPCNGFNLLKDNRRWHFQAAAIPHHPFRRTPAAGASSNAFCSVFSHLKLSGAARRLSLAAGKNCDAKSRQPLWVSRKVLPRKRCLPAGSIPSSQRLTNSVSPANRKKHNLGRIDTTACRSPGKVRQRRPLFSPCAGKAGVFYLAPRLQHQLFLKGRS